VLQAEEDISRPLPKQHFFVERIIKKWEDVDDHSTTATM